MTERRIIAVDIGNSRLKAGLVDLGAAGTADAPLPPVVDCVHLPVEKPMQWQDLQAWVRSAGSPGATWWLASVNPPVLESLVDWLQASGHPHRELRDPSLLPLNVDLPHPEKTGIDRLLGAVAANALRPPHKPAIIVDAGSAMTIDAVSPDGSFLGGAILPGPTLAARALHEFTYWLPLVDPVVESLRDSTPVSERPAYDRPPPVPPCPLGKNTTDALAAGLFWGTVGAARELISRLTRQLGWQDPFVILTGGDAPPLADHLAPSASLLPHLTLQGIALTARHQPTA